MRKDRSDIILVSLCVVAFTTIGLIVGLTLRNGGKSGTPQQASPSSVDSAFEPGQTLEDSADKNEILDEQETTEILWPHEESDIPPNPDIRFGTLDNGFRYMILPHSEPQEEVSLRMHVDVGSFMEDDDQLGLAQFLMHMLFNGLRNFAPDELIETMQTLGIDFGPSLNAYSAFDETVYQLQLRDNSEETLDICFTVMRDWVDGALLLEEEIEQERGVLLSAHDYRDTVRSRMTEQLYNFLIPNSLVSARYDPDNKVLATELITKEELANFYRQYYTPERITLAVVGDIKPDEIETLIAEKFSSATNPEDPGLDPELGSVESGSGFRTAVFADDEFQYNELYLYNARDFVSLPDTTEKRVDDLSLAMANSILKRRLEVRVLEEGTPITYANVRRRFLDGAVELGYITVDHMDGHLEEGVMMLEQEFRRFMEYGVVQSEFEEAKANVLNGYEERVERADTQESRDLATDLSDSVNGRRVVSSPDVDLRLVTEALDQLTPEQVHEDFFAYWNTTDIALVYLTKDTSDPQQLEEQLEMYYVQSTLVQVDPPIDSSDVTFAYTDFGPPGTIESESTVVDLDIRQLVLSNNVRVNIKTTDFDDNSIIFTARFGSGRLSQPSGSTDLDDFAETMINYGGLGSHSTDELRRLNAGKTVGIDFSVEDSHFTFSGSTNPDDLELMFQLVAAHLSDPGYREEAVRLFRHEIPPYISRLEHTLSGPIKDSFYFLRGGDDRFAVPTEEELMSFVADDARAWLDPELQDSYLELSIVGDIPGSAIDYILNTIGALPARAEAPQNQEDLNNDLVFPDTPQSLSMTFDSDIATAAVFVAWEIPPLIETTIEIIRRLNFVVTTFDERLRVQLREELGAAFAYGAVNNPLRGFDHGELYAWSYVSPENTTLVMDRIHSIASNIAQDGITDDEFNRLAVPLMENLEDSLRSNEYWLYTVMDGCQAAPYKLEWSRNRGNFYDSVTKEDANEVTNYITLSKAVSIDIRPVDASSGVDQPNGKRFLLHDLEVPKSSLSMMLDH